MGSGTRAGATDCLAVVPLLLLILLVARGADAVGLWRPPPEAGSGLLGAAPSRYLTREEHWMNQTLDHFTPTVKYPRPRFSVLCSFQRGGLCRGNFCSAILFRPSPDRFVFLPVSELEFVLSYHPREMKIMCI
jgi:hypothetical protein